MQFGSFEGSQGVQAMGAHLLLKMQLSQCSTISHLLNFSTQSKDMESNGVNSQRVLGRASWSRKYFRKFKRRQRTSSPRKRGLRGINTPLLKTSRYSSQFSGVFSRDSYLGVLRALLTESNNQCCIPLDSTTYLYLRLNIKHISST